MKLWIEAMDQLLLTMWHVIPWLTGLGAVFALLSHYSPCNRQQAWWKKQGLMTDLSYWIFTPIFTRYLRIWVTVLFTIWIFHIHDGQQIAQFYEHGHGTLAVLPLWQQGFIYLVVGDFALYWSHRVFHGQTLWKYHAVHHAPTQVDWISAARFHPLNIALGPAGFDIAALLSGISPDIFLVIGPFNIITSCLVHANLNWTFGIFRPLFASPVFHRWHHASTVRDVNFASTFSLWDLLFGTYHMPKGELPQVYGIEGEEVPDGLMPQLLYPLTHRA